MKMEYLTSLAIGHFKSWSNNPYDGIELRELAFFFGQ